MSKLEYVDDVVYEGELVNLSSPYVTAYYEAMEKRFGKRPVTSAPVQAATPVAAPAVTKRYFKRRTVIISLILILSVLVIAFAAISALGKIDAIDDYVKVVHFDSVRDIGEDVVALFSKDDVAIMEYVAPIAFLLSLVLAVVVLILAIVAFGAKKRIHIWIAALLALVLGLASGAAWVMLTKAKPDAIVDFISPTVAEGLQYGYVIVVGLQLLTFIFSCFAYKRIRK
ncbi:MAG: hypothetical protein WC292_01385 [Clostridia bacterium]